MIDRYGRDGKTMLRRRGAGRVTMAAAREDTTRKGQIRWQEKARLDTRPTLQTGNAEATVASFRAACAVCGMLHMCNSIF